jgi:hypothetical protein
MYLESTRFQKLDLFSSSSEGREAPTLLDPLKRANHNHWICFGLQVWDGRHTRLGPLDRVNLSHWICNRLQLS